MTQMTRDDLEGTSSSSDSEFVSSASLRPMPLLLLSQVMETKVQVTVTLLLRP